MPIHRTVNKKFFKKWNPDMAYILGFLFADGNIICSKRNTWFWSIQISDQDILEKIKNTINSSHAISLRPKKQGHKQLYRLQIGSKDMCADLLALGLIEKKSKIISFPQKIPKKYFPDFVRGYFDGDGGVWFGMQRNKSRGKPKLVLSTFFTSGSKNFLVTLREELILHGLGRGSLVKKMRGFDLKYSISDSLILAKIMYNSKSSLFLTRKKERFEKYKEMRS